MSRGEIQAAPSSEPLFNERLESWKEIAAYLKREIRTVQRWEKEEGLPVHRHQHRKQGTVYAYRVELDAWLEQRQPELEAKEQAEARRQPQAGWRRALLATAVVVSLAAAGYASWRVFWRAPEKVMLAVLPLENLSADPEQDYFSQGLTEEMITQLGGLQPDKFGVIALTTARQYQDTEKTVEEIGRELGVHYIVEGSVRREDDRVRITAQLIQVDDQAHLWTETYEQRLSTILTVQREVARAVAREIRLTLTPEKEIELAGTESIDPEAYEAYLRGLQAFNRWSAKDWLEAKSYFENTVQKDPVFARGQAWLALSYDALGFFGLLPAREAYPQARAAAEEALKLKPTLGEPYVALSVASFAYDWDWARAQEEIERALQLSPNSPWPHWAYGWQLTALKRHDEAIAEMTRARDLDPLNPYMNTSLGEMYWFADRFAEAEEIWQNVAERHPQFSRTYLLLRLMYEERGMYEEALAAFEKELKSKGAGTEAADSLRQAYTRSGREGYWRWKLQQLEQAHKEGSDVPAIAFAKYYDRLGDNDQALAFLEKAFQERSGHLIMLQVGPRWELLRDDPRFQEYVRRMNFPSR